jgi:SNF2 family DNA or RNA helicase
MPHAELNAQADRIDVATQYIDAPLIKQVPGGRYAKEEGGWSVPLSWPSCIMLRGLFGEKLTVGPRLAEWSHRVYGDRLHPASLIRSSLTAEAQELTGEMAAALTYLDVIEKDAPRKLYDYQRADLAFLVANRRALLGNEPGLGKTGVVIRFIQVLAMMGIDPFPVVIVCPNSLKRAVWEPEFKLWAPELTVSIVDGGAATRRKQLAAKADVFVINYESARLHSRQAGYGQMKLTDAQREPKEINALKPRVAIFDEAHKVKDPHAQQTRTCWATAQEAEYRVAMTGTPVANHIGDFWSILHLLEPAWWPAKTKWMERYADTSFGMYGGVEVHGLRGDTQTELFKTIDPLTRRVPKMQALPQLPPKLPVQYRHTPMSPAQAKAYKQMSEHMIAQLDNGEWLKALKPIQQFTRLQQFACASAQLIDDGSLTGTVKMTNPSAKVDDLVDLLEEMGEAPLVVAAVSRQLIELAADRLKELGISYGMVTGAQSTVERQQAVERFQGGRDRVMLLTTGAGATGLTLTRADTLLFLQAPYSLVERKQAEDRIHRIGSEIHECVRIIEQVTPGTVEETKLELMAAKGERFEEVMRDEEIIRLLLGMKG